MLTSQEVTDYLDALAPLSLACEWDNAGLLIDSGEAVTGILCALDITDAVVCVASPGYFSSAACALRCGRTVPHGAAWGVGRVHAHKSGHGERRRK
ncbi:MAG: Nif3-like dinuclear metal center hexameric protein [Ruthenibacterium sp.]